MPEELLYRDLLVGNRIGLVKEWITQNSFEIYVYEDQESKVIKGMMGFGKYGDADEKNAFELHFIYIDPDFSHKGIGSEMIEFFEHEGKKNRYSEFVIWVLEENQIGINCYKKNQYCPDGKTKIFKRFNKKEIRFIKIAEFNTITA